MKLIKFFFILLLLLNSCISILTANEYRQNLNFQLTSKYSQQDVLSRKIIVNDSVKLVISEKPHQKPVVANRFEYLPYGETWITEGDGNNNPKYNSQELDKETNFYFYNARSFRFNCQSQAIPETNEVAHYDPEICRFVTADTVIDGEGSVSGWNRYMYVAGNPISYRDPTGHSTTGEELNRWARERKGNSFIAFFVAEAWNVLGFEGVSKLADSAINDRKLSKGDYVEAGLEVIPLGKVVKVSKNVFKSANGAVKNVTKRVAKTSIKTKGGSTAGKALTKKAIVPSNGFFDGIKKMNKEFERKRFEACIGHKCVALKKGCFTKNTLILRENGNVVIQDIEVGDYVYSKNIETGEIELNKVLQTFIREIDKLVILELDNGDIIETTDEHPFWVVGENNYIKAKKLRIDDELLLVNQQKVKIRDYRIRILSRAIKVYNFEVEGNHNYFVGSGVLVHNADDCFPKGAGTGAKKWKFNGKKDLDWRGAGKSHSEALDEAFKRTGVSKSEFKVTKWGKNANGKSYPAEYRVESGINKGAEVSVDLGHIKNGPIDPHVGYQTPGKRAKGGGERGHIILDSVPYNR